MNLENCPSQKILIRFNEGRLSHSDINLVSDHLKDCCSCLEFLDQLAPGNIEQGFQDADSVSSPVSKHKTTASSKSYSKISSPSDPELDIHTIQTGQYGEEIYSIERTIGCGSLGTVYQAEDYLGSMVAVKVSDRDKLFTQDHVQNFLFDSCDARLLKHLNILPVIEIGLWNSEQGYLVMPLVADPTLTQYYSEVQPIETTLHLFDQICEALKHAHEMEVLHRNFNPDSAFVLPNDHIVVSDFGLVFDGRYQFDLVSPMEDKVEFMSPEAVENLTARIDVRADVYSAGAVLYWMLCRTSQTTPAQKQILKPIIKRCLRRSRSERFQSIDQLQSAFQELTTLS